MIARVECSGLFTLAEGLLTTPAEAPDLTGGFPLTIRERLFALRPSEGKVCPEATFALILTIDKMTWTAAVCDFADV